jgi:hypothetical protein
MRNSSVSAKSTSATETDQPELSAYRKTFLRADKFCREVQSFIAEAGIPAMNEMRYAGHHLLSSIDDAGTMTKPAHLTKAINHAHRACYEAGEAGIIEALSRIASFKDDYRHVSITGVIPHYLTISDDAETARDRVGADREHVERLENAPISADDGTPEVGLLSVDYNEYMVTFSTLKKHCRTLDTAREELNKITSQERKGTQRFVIQVLIGVFAIAVTIAVAVIYAPKPDAKVYILPPAGTPLQSPLPAASTGTPPRAS